MTNVDLNLLLAERKLTRMDYCLNPFFKLVKTYWTFFTRGKMFSILCCSYSGDRNCSDFSTLIMANLFPNQFKSGAPGHQYGFDNSGVHSASNNYAAAYPQTKLHKKKLHGLSPRANYTDRATAASRRSDCQLVRIEGATWSA
jgi:hypothetical protein